MRPFLIWEIAPICVKTIFYLVLIVPTQRILTSNSDLPYNTARIDVRITLLATTRGARGLLMFLRNLAVAICCALGHMVVYYMPYIVKVAANVFDLETRQVRTFCRK